MQTTTTEFHEIVLQGNEVFSRNSFLTPLGNIDKLILEKLKEPAYQFLPLCFPPMIDNWTLGHWFGEDQYSEDILCFTEISYVPLKGAKLDPQGHLYLRRQIPMIEEDELRYFDEKWTPPHPVRTFLFTPYSPKMAKLGDPYIFACNHPSQGPMSPKIPNVYNTGRICPGREYMAYTSRPTIESIKCGLECIKDSLVNIDLRSIDKEFMQWDDNLKQIEIPFNTHHYNDITDARIVAFYSWARKNEII